MGVNTVMRSLCSTRATKLVPDHAHQACRNTIDFVADRWGAKVVTVQLPFPIKGPHVVIESMLGAVTDRTVLAMIDTVTSPTGLPMPYGELTAQLEGQGVALLDAAHGIGMVPLNLDELASHTTSNCHKWLCALGSPSFTFARTGRLTFTR